MQGLHGHLFVAQGFHRFAAERYEVMGYAGLNRVAGSREAIVRTQLSSVHLYQRPDGRRFDSTRTSMGGAVVDSGKFDWSASDKFPSLSQPEPAYHGLAFHPTLGAMAYTFHSIAVGLRDLGMTMNPQGAHYTLMGMDTLSLRMERHVANARKVAAWLEKDPRVEFVTYAGLPSSPYYKRAKKLMPKGAGAIFTVVLRGGCPACRKLVE